MPPLKIRPQLQSVPSGLRAQVFAHLAGTLAIDFLTVPTVSLTPALATVIIFSYHDNMIRTQISVDEQLYRRAKIIARRKGISLAELCRRSLEEVVAKEPSDKPWMAFAGIFEGNESDSQSVDDVVYGREAP